MANMALISKVVLVVYLGLCMLQHGREHSSPSRGGGTSQHTSPTTPVHSECINSLRAGTPQMTVKPCCLTVVLIRQSKVCAHVWSRCLDQSSNHQNLWYDLHSLPPHLHFSYLNISLIPYGSDQPMNKGVQVIDVALYFLGSHKLTQRDFFH